MLQKNDFVIIKENYDEIVANSVGLIKNTHNNICEVYFFGKDKIISLPNDKMEFLDITKTGKPYKKKICNKCFVLKTDFVDFDVNQTDAKGRKTTRPSCRECRKEIDGVAMPQSEKERMNKIRPKYCFKCPICGKISIPDITAKLVMDHNHYTGKGRAWLCDSCNTGLGRFKDNIEVMKKAIKYLEYYEKLENK